VRATVEEKVISFAIIGSASALGDGATAETLGAGPVSDVVILAVLFDRAVSMMILRPAPPLTPTSVELAAGS
jgi:hypothetical protein